MPVLPGIQAYGTVLCRAKEVRKVRLIIIMGVFKFYDNCVWMEEYMPEEFNRVKKHNVSAKVHGDATCVQN